MTDLSSPQAPLPPAETDALEHFRRAIEAGQHWYLALLETIGRWRTAEEVYRGRRYRYLVGNEAFDWLLLAERLCQSVDGLIPEQEGLDLLFFGKPPLELSPQEFRERIGPSKYRAYLNFLYGVTVEEALQLAMEEELEKEQGIRVYRGAHPGADLYQRIYGASRDELWQAFWKERGGSPKGEVAWPEYQEFTYWLFKYRLQHCHKARVASDTKKALDLLRRLRSHPSPRGTSWERSGEPEVIELGSLPSCQADSHQGGRAELE